MSKAGIDNKEVELVFTSVKGTKIFALTDITKISAYRGLSAEKARRYAEFNLTKKELELLLKAAKDAVNTERDFVKCMSIIQEIEFRTKFICEENSLLDLACIYFFLEGEDIEIPSDSLNSKKIKFTKEEPDLRSFFLQSALHLTKRFSESQEKDLLGYLEEIKVISERLLRFIAKES